MDWLAASSLIVANGLTTKEGPKHSDEFRGQGSDPFCQRSYFIGIGQ